VSGFTEKPQGDGGWINGGFFVLSSDVFRYIDGDLTLLEREPLQRLAIDGQLSAYRHTGFWQPMDTLRHKQVLEDLWASGSPPWKIWK
jgi:glucose-1-phosphate cytidylyltransferase